MISAQDLSKNFFLSMSLKKGGAREDAALLFA